MRPRTASPTPSRTPWPTAEEEKQRLFERAQAKARHTQGLTQTSPRPPNSSSGRLGHHPTASVTSSQDSHTNRALSPYIAASPPTMSAGAALYSHALASMNRPMSSVTSNTPPVDPSAPRRTVSHSASIGNASSVTTQQQHANAEEEKAALRYFEARKAVERRQRDEGSIPESIPQEDPIAYDALFPPTSPNALSLSVSGGSAMSQLSEKETLRQVYEARDAAAASNQPPPPATSPLASSTQVVRPERTMTPPVDPSGPLSEKEVLRRAFEARDAAMIRSGQPPLTATPPVQPPPPPPVQSSSWTGPSSSSGPPRTALSEKEQMRLAFEARDRALAAQQVPSLPDYDLPPSRSLGPSPGPSPPFWNDGGPPLTAAAEKAQLEARYAEEDGISRWQAGIPLGDSSPAQPPDGVERPVLTPHKQSYKPDSSECYLRRDPTISAGKKRASQMITPPPPSPPPPPPLPPRPPAEYIEETKLEDMRNVMAPTASLPSDFSSSFDGSFGEHRQISPIPLVPP